MPRGYLHPGQVHDTFFLVVIEGSAHILAVVHHFQTLRHPGQQPALDRGGQQRHRKDHMEQVSVHRYTCRYRHNGKHRAGRAPEPCPGDQRNLPQTAFRRPQQHIGGNRPGQEGHNAAHRQRHGQIGRHLLWKAQKANNEKNRNLSKSCDPVKEGDQRPLLADGPVAQQNAE